MKMGAEVKKTKNLKNPSLRVETLIQALPYIQKFRGKTFVIKYGGSAMTDLSLKKSTIRDILLLSCVGINVILVHGGGKEINQMVEKLNMKVQFVDGHRVTDAKTMEIVEMVLNGKVQKDLVNLININGGHAIGLSGKDGRLFSAKPLHKKNKLGFIGDVFKVDPEILYTLLEKGFIPVVSSVGADPSGQNYNINADNVACSIANAIKASKLILMTDIDGVLKDPKDPKSLISKITTRDAKILIRNKTISGGMIPKINAAVNSINSHVGAVHIINGNTQHSLLLETFTDSGIGTMIVK